MEGLSFRAATPADVRTIAELVAGDPGNEAIGITGGRKLARKLGLAWAEREARNGMWRHTTLAEIDARPVGALQAGLDLPELKVTLSVALFALRVLGPWRLISLQPRFQARSRVATTVPPGAYYIHEVHVAPALRNRGIGGALMRLAEEQAREASAPAMALSTTTDNPARHLYERLGYRVVDTRRDPAYERYTGIEGRLLMVKDLR